MQIISWDEYFMSIAQLASMRSKDKRTQVGACIVNERNHIVSTGYNGMPNKCHDSIMPWDKGEGLNDKHLYVVHAELNAILNSEGNLKGCKLYTTLFPCNECAKAIVQSGISEIIYLDDKYKDFTQFKASRFILDTAKIKYRQLKSNLEINIQLNINIEKK